MSTPARVLPSRSTWRPRLQVVRSPEPSRSFVPFVVGCVVILVAALVTALLLNTAMAVSSYRVHDQQIQLAQLRETEAELQAQLESLGSPAVLRSQALSLGMVPPEATAYLSIATGTITGANPGGSH
ncbi:MAG: hypothetical protein GX427_12225 [Actinomycetales bacterium]|jgi:CLIP, MHC2 interacting.|nr:hypothetical protein [Actinomycetales bacterium]